jgi:hypothetical protein
MRYFLASALLLITAAAPAAAQVELKTYANANGYIDVQALTCAQLANTYQEDADHLKRLVQWARQETFDESRSCEGS